MTASLMALAVAAVLELTGCWLVWAVLREGRPIWWLAPALACLIGFAVVLTRVETGFAGRAFAVYGGIYLLSAALWATALEGMRPTPLDALGLGLALAGALILLRPLAG